MTSFPFILMLNANKVIFLKQSDNLMYQSVTLINSYDSYFENDL